MYLSVIMSWRNQRTINPHMNLSHRCTSSMNRTNIYNFIIFQYFNSHFEINWSSLWKGFQRLYLVLFSFSFFFFSFMLVIMILLIICKFVKLYINVKGNHEMTLTSYLQFSMVFGNDSRRLPETSRTLSFDKQPMELGKHLSWLECTSNTTTLSNLAVKDSGIIYQE